MARGRGSSDPSPDSSALWIFICRVWSHALLGISLRAASPAEASEQPTWEMPLCSEVWSSESACCGFLQPKVQSWGK